MTTFVQVFRLVQAYGPELTELVRVLAARFGGDRDLVRAELRRITDHGARGEAAEAGFDARVAAVRAARGRGDQS